MHPFGRAVRGYGLAAALAKLVAVLVAPVPAAAAAEVRLLALGDSLTAGFGLPEGEGFVPRLEAWLAAHGAPDVTIVNGGVSGDTSAGGLARIGWALGGDDVDAVIVALGANDMLRGIDPAVTRANLDGILDAIDAAGMPAMLAGVPAPPNYPEDFRRAYDAMFRELAAEHDAIYYASFFAGLGPERGVREVMRLFQGDGLHPNANGVHAIVEHIGPVALELVEEARGR